MDILKDYITQTKKTKITISSFFKKERATIETYCNNLQPNDKKLDLKVYWAEEIDNFAKENPAIQVIKDYYLIDFVDLEIKRRNHILNNQIKLDILETRENAARELSANIHPLSSMSVFERLENQRRKLKHCEDYHNKDLLYSYIIDFATTSKNQSVYEVFSKEQRKHYFGEYKPSLNIITGISSATKDILRNIKNKTLKEVLKDAKIDVRNLEDTENKKIQKKIIKTCKIYRDIMETDDANKFGGHLNEDEFIHQFLYLLFKQVLFDCHLVYRLDEAHPQCATVETDDDQRPIIDIIFLHKIHQFAISVCEVSGPHYKTNKNHFLGDRNKLALNMRSILNHIENIPATPNATAFKKIKIYGFQVYLNKLYIYSLSTIANGYTVFILEKTLPLPVSFTFLRAQLPAFLGWLWNINSLFKQVISQIDSFIEISAEEEILQIDSQPSSQESSSSKRQRTN